MSTSPGFTALDTAAMPWQPMGGIAGFKTRMLRIDPATQATVEIQFAPPGFSEEVRARLAKGASRHYHRTVTERHYFLSGDLPNCDWTDWSDKTGELTVYRRHMFLDRPPLTLHGLLPGHLSEAGSEYLVWNTGAGTALWSPEAATESVVLPVDAGPEYAADFGRPRILHVDRLPWQAHPVVPTWLHKRLAAAAGGSPQVDVVGLPAGAPGLRAPLLGAEGPEHWLFVLSGGIDVEVRGVGRTTPLALHEGGFLDLASGSGVAVVEGDATSQGAVVLCVGGDLAAAE